jgi:DNA-binding transcriptional regulator YbjK
MTPATRPRGAARREALLEAALEVVAQAGPEAVTHRRVAEVAELPLASTTYWFSSKDELLAAALAHAAARDIARLRAAAAELAARPPSSPAQLADELVELLLAPLEEGLRDSRRSLIAAYSLWFEAARRPALQAIARRWTAAYREAAAELLARAGSAQPSGDAEILIGAADGLSMTRLAEGESGSLRPRLRRLVRALLEHPPAEPRRR